jgi:hypothetical protein
MSKEYSDALQLHQLAVKVIKQGEDSARWVALNELLSGA